MNDSEAFRVWLAKYKAEAVIGFHPGLFWECKTPEGKPIPFVCLHASPQEGTRHIPGAYAPEELYTRQALRQLDGLIRHGDCGVPEHAYDLIIHTLWCPGSPPPPFHSDCTTCRP